MALAVWLLYAADRLLDTRDARPREKLEARHIFHHRHRKAFLIGIAVAAIALAALLPGLDPTAIRLYLVEGALLALWFLILHATPGAHRLPKEIAVGLFFSAAIFIPTVAREPGLRPSLLPCAILFAALCSLNCLFIYAWEHSNNRPASHRDRAPNSQPPHATTRIALAYLRPLAIGTAALAISAAIFAAHFNRCLVPAACALAAILLLILDRNRHRLAGTNLRAAADLALLTPLLLLPLLR
jgi:hypothetical protein